MDSVSTVVDLDPSHLFRGNFGFSQGLENNVVKWRPSIILQYILG